MDVGGPHSSEEQHSRVSVVMDGQQEQASNVRCGLEHAIQRVECQTSKWRQGILFVVSVVVFVQRNHP